MRSTVQYETFDHGADIGIRGFGSTMGEAFENAALALYSVIVNVSTVLPNEQRRINVSASDPELLLVEWLNSLLAISDMDRMVFSRFEVSIDRLSLVGMAWGEVLDQVRHEPHVEVKGATYHMLSVKEQQGRFTAQCVVDV